MPRTLPLVALLTLLVLPLASARGEDEASPHAAYREAVKQLPAPSAAAGFTYECEARMNGRPLGTVTFEAVPSEDGAQWRVTDTYTFGGGALVRTSTAVLDRHLRPVSGRIEGTEPGADGFEITWARTPTGFAAKHTATRSGETSTSEKAYEHEGAVTTTLCSLLLFARGTKMGAGRYAVTVFDADPGVGDPALDEASWTQGAVGTWGEQSARLLEGRKGENDMSVGFHADTGAFLGMRTKNASKGFDMEIRPKAPEPTVEADDLFARPARSAREVALQAGLAFAVKDLALTERVIHWPSIHAEAAAGHQGPDPFPDVATFKAATMKELEKSLTERPRAMIESVLEATQDQLREEPVEGGFTKVTFPPMFKGLVMTTGQIDGQWYLVRLPATAK